MRGTGCRILGGLQGRGRPIEQCTVGSPHATHSPHPSPPPLPPYSSSPPVAALPPPSLGAPSHHRRDDLVHELDHGDLGAEAAPDGGHLEADDAAADDDHLLRNSLEGDGARGRHDPAIVEIRSNSSRDGGVIHWEGML